MKLRTPYSRRLKSTPVLSMPAEANSGVPKGDIVQAAVDFSRRAIPIILAALLLAVPGNAGARTNKPERDFTFILMSDTHVGYENLNAKPPPFTMAETLAETKSGLSALRALVGKPYPDRPELAGLNLGVVRPPRGLIILGDLTDGHKEPSRQVEQWRTFEDLFPIKGFSICGGRVPVFASAGNHDGDVAGPQRQGLVNRNRKLDKAGQLAAISTNGVHYALNWDGVHFIGLNLCAADMTDPETPFKFGKPGAGSWNDPQGALSFLKDYLARRVGKSGEPVVLMQHYGFDGFSMNDWNWWTAKQRRALYDLLKDYNVAAIFHGHNHHAEHYRWPDPNLHAADLGVYFDGKPPKDFRQYDIISCGPVGWVMRIRGDQLIAAHFKGPGWTTDTAGYYLKSLKL